MLNTLAEYGCTESGPIRMRKSGEAIAAGAIEWLIHS
jgi:hypothetical protein